MLYCNLTSTLISAFSAQYPYSDSSEPYYTVGKCYKFTRFIAALPSKLLRYQLNCGGKGILVGSALWKRSASLSWHGDCCRVRVVLTSACAMCRWVKEARFCRPPRHMWLLSRWRSSIISLWRLFQTGEEHDQCAAIFGRWCLCLLVCCWWRTEESQRWVSSTLFFQLVLMELMLAAVCGINNFFKTFFWSFVL